MRWPLVFLLLSCWGASAFGDRVVFRDSFRRQLRPGWTWVRETPGGWRVGRAGLEIRVVPGNMWGPANDARNVLVRELPPASKTYEVTVTVTNTPTEQYEQVDLVGYAGDSHQVKIGFELVDGKRCIVMGREEADRTRTITIIPVEGTAFDLRLVFADSTLTGSFRPVGAKAWREAGRCDAPWRGNPRIALQCYQGPAGTEHWARLANFTIRELKPKGSGRQMPK